MRSQPVRRIYAGCLPKFGNLRLAAELRDPGGMDVVKRAIVPSVVSPHIPDEIGLEESEIKNDTLWTWDRIRLLAQQIIIHATAH